MRQALIATGLLLGGLALAACGSSGPGVQARQTGDTTATSAPETTTTTAAPATTAPATTAPPATAAAPAELPCTAEALGAAFTAAKQGSLAGFKVQQCVSGWATSSETHGYGPPTFTLYRAEGDHWVAVNHSAAKLCEGQGVPPAVAPLIGCDS
jgi:hypothetical protein